MCMFDDADGYWLELEDAHQRARVPHQCDECGRTIAPGETYRRTKGIAELQDFVTVKTCAHCEWAARWLTKVCRGYLMTAVREDLEEHWNESPVYRNLNLGRRIVGMRRQWRRRDGSLMDVPTIGVVLPPEAVAA